jgi:hypothetical protein
MLNKISPIRNDKDRNKGIKYIYLVINVLVSIEDQFNLIEFKYDDSQKLGTTNKLITVSKGIIECSNKITATRLYLDKFKKM